MGAISLVAELSRLMSARSSVAWPWARSVEWTSNALAKAALVWQATAGIQCCGTHNSSVARACASSRHSQAEGKGGC